MTNDDNIIDFDDRTLIDFNDGSAVRSDDLPEGLTLELAEEARALVVRLRGAGLHVLFLVANQDRDFQFTAGSARVLRDMTEDAHRGLWNYVEQHQLDRRR